MKEKIIIIGGGGHAKVVISIILAMPKAIPVGILDPLLSVGDAVLSVPVLGDEGWLLTAKKEFALTVGVGAMKATEVRKEIYQKLHELGHVFSLIIHPSATVCDHVFIGEGTQVMPHAVIQTDAQVGRNCIVNTGAIVEHDCILSDHSHVAPGAVLGGGVTVGECSLVGLGARVLPWVHIGRHVTVGAGAVVTKNVPDNAVVVGVPACQRESGL